MKTRVLTIGSAAVLLVLAAGAGGLYAYDSSRSDVIAKGITAGGVDVGGLNVTSSHEGSAVQKRGLAARILRQLRDPTSTHVAVIPTRTLRPHVSSARLAYKYQTFITIDRAHFALRLWKNLHLARSYRIAVGRQGLETPAGLYEINDRQVNPSWHVPNSSWAGALAGRVIPPGPEDPIKARWLGFYNGPGIHGTDEISSPGTAASHGCLRS